MSEHPKLTLTTRLATKHHAWQFAVALRGQSTGWGRDKGRGRPRRWFFSHHSTTTHEIWTRGLCVVLRNERLGENGKRVLIDFRTSGDRAPL